MPMCKAYSGITYPPPDLRDLCTGLAEHNRQVHTIVIATTYKRAAELLNESRVDKRITARRMNNYWSVSGNRVHLELAMGTEAVYLCKYEPSMAASSKEDYVKIWSKAE